MAQGKALSAACLAHVLPLTYHVVQDHNRRCLERLEPYLKDDKRAIKYLRREAERGIGIASAVPGGLTIDWD